MRQNTHAQRTTVCPSNRGPRCLGSGGPGGNAAAPQLSWNQTKFGKKKGHYQSSQSGEGENGTRLCHTSILLSTYATKKMPLVRIVVFGYVLFLSPPLVNFPKQSTFHLVIKRKTKREKKRSQKGNQLSLVIDDIFVSSDHQNALETVPPHLARPLVLPSYCVQLRSPLCVCVCAMCAMCLSLFYPFPEEHQTVPFTPVPWYSRRLSPKNKKKQAASKPMITQSKVYYAATTATAGKQKQSCLVLRRGPSCLACSVSIPGRSWVNWGAGKKDEGKPSIHTLSLSLYLSCHPDPRSESFLPLPIINLFGKSACLD